MATATAAPHSPPAPTDPTRRFWQVPILLLGVGVFVSVWQGWLPIGNPNPDDGFIHDRDALKAAYERLTPDPVDLKNQLNNVAGKIERYRPDQVPVARFHLGSGYVRLAEVTTAPDEAHGYWTLAHQHFDLIVPKQLQDPLDVPKFAFRSAKAKAAVGLPANAPNADLSLLATVLSAPPPGDDAGETHRLIADLALRENPPDIARAKVELTKYLEATGIATPAASMARARLRLGMLYLETQDSDQARKWLEQVGTDAPADVYGLARAKLAQVLMADGRYADAGKEWEALRAASVPVLRQTATYQLALCKLKTRDTEAAVQLFGEAAKGDGPEASAAAIQLADQHLRIQDPARHKAAVDLLVGALKGIRTSAEYDSTLISLNDVRGVFELAVTKLLDDGAHESAMKAAEAYAAVAAPGRDRERRADVLGAWGIAIQKAKGDAKPKFKAAADEFAALAEFQPKADGKIDMLRKSASLYRQADEPASAALRLEEAAELKDIPEPVQVPLWLELADALLASGQTNKVFIIWNKVMASLNKPLATATRYRLARQFVDTRHAGLVPLGRALFEQIVKQENVSPDEREYHERAFGDLAHILIHEGSFADAETRARAQLKQYPNGPWAGHARLYLGVALLQRAGATTTPAGEATRMRTEALTCFSQIVTDCDALERRTGKLPEREAWLRVQAAVRVLQTYQQMRTPQSANKLLADGSAMRDRYKGTVEELIVLSLIYHAFKQLNEPGKALEIRDQMRDVFQALPPSAFTQQTGEYSRDYWLKVWFPPEPKK